VVRAYASCLSCSTHAAGRMPLHVQVLGADGAVVNEITRD
jgi:NAD-reducing hydrogenase large subunit